MSEKEYLDAIDKFYNNRLKSQIKKKHQQCEGCDEKKQFIVKENQLIFSCGAKSGKCGPQIIINLPKYLYYPEMKSDVDHVLNYHLDKSKVPDIYSKQEIKDQQDVVKENYSLLKKTRKVFLEQNDSKHKSELIKKYHKQRIQLKKEQSLLLLKISDETDPDKLYTLREDYLQLNNQLKEQYRELFNTIKPMNNFIAVKPGEALTKNKTKD